MHTKICGIVGLPIVAAALVAACLSGCTSNPGNGVATVGNGSTTPTSSGPAPASDTQQRLRQYATCLRQHGVNVPDPDQGKSVQISQSNNDPQAKAAAQACQQYAIGADNGGKSSAGIAQERTYAACMRQHGLANFPDPDPDNGLVVPKTVLNSPGYPAANQACAGTLGKNGS